jgi:mannose-1-phosphate guanylyltransferase
MSRLVAVIMAGGSGTRFWPRSRAARPKQLLAFGDERPLLVQTSARLAGLVSPERQFVITGARIADDVRALLPDVPESNVIGEPEGRDTAACVGLAGRLAARLDPDAIVVAMPADHVIAPAEDYRRHVAAAEQALAAHPSSVLVFGVTPDRPATGYGWLRQGQAVGTFGGCAVHRLEAFIEKPDRARAEAMLAAGGHCWNAGLFAFRPDALATAYAEHLPAMGAPLDALAAAWCTPRFEAALAEHYPKLQKVSIDYGVMEKLSGTLLMPLPLSWDDVGAWDALARLLPTDADGNVTDGDAVLQDAHGLIVSATQGVVAARGVADLIVVHVPDATLVCRKDDAEGVKRLVEALRERGFDRYL